MPENNDLNNEQSVTAQDLNSAGSVAQQDLQDQSVNDQTQDGKLADGTDENKTVPYAKLKEAADARKVAEEATAHAQRELELLQANMQGQQQGQQQNAQQQQPGSTFEQAMQQLGLTDDDLFGENVRKVNVLVGQLNAANSQVQNTVQANMQFANTKPDFSQVVGSVNPMTGAIPMLSKEAAEILQKKPHLANASYQAVYEEIIRDREFTQFQAIAAAEKEHLVRQGVDADTLPLGGSAAGGGTGGDNQTPQMLSREQSNDIRQRIANGETV